MKAVGAENVADFEAKLTAFIAEANSAKTFMAENQVTLESINAKLTALEGKILTEDRVKAIVGETTGPAATNAVKAWATSEEGKKIIGAESSRISMEALANVGTQPAKPAPVGASGNDTAEDKAKTLIAQGKFEEAFPLLPASERADFMGAKSYGAYMRNRHSTKISGN